MVSISFLVKVARKVLVITSLPLLMGVGLGTDQEAAPLPDVPDATWAVDPTTPGDDLPQRGRSLFDRLFSVERHGQGFYGLPFPFTDLIKALEARLVDKKGERMRVKQVLIPLGRSLQRHAAAPDYFKYPRVVVAVDGEPNTSGDFLLKDRLFLGYQEKANLIEVISYNEQDGRFEFQLVRDYGANSVPQVFYARRVICLSCHQNGGPIFSKAAWSETAANPKIASRLLDEGRAYFDIPVNRSAVDPFAVDSATDRANMLLPYQLLWREGCGHSPANANHCRAAAFRAALQYRLSGNSHFDRQSASYQSEFLHMFRQNWSKQWPGGIKIPNPDLPNRDPISQNGRIATQLDPLMPRTPLEVWSVDRMDDVERMIKGISESITTPDIRQLDAYLFSRGQRSGATTHKFNSACEFGIKRFSESTYRVSFDCWAGARHDDGFEMAGRLYIDTDKVTDGVIDALRLTDGVVLKRLGFRPANLRFSGNHWRVSLSLYQQPYGLRARLPTGNALQSVELHWLDPPPASGDATLSVMHDFDPVRDAVAELSSRTKQNPFSFGPFQAAHTMHALFEQLGVTSDSVCCHRVAPMPVARIDSEHANLLAKNSRIPIASTDVKAFFKFCGSCHRTEATFPPNFLLGDSDRVMANLAQCAPRIWYRLNMWRIPEAQRTKSPMPPATAVQAFSSSVDRWPMGNEFVRLQDYVAGLLKSRNASTDRLLYRDYETLPACMSDTLNRGQYTF